MILSLSTWKGPHLLGDWGWHFWVTEKILASSWNFNDRPSCLIHYIPGLWVFISDPGLNFPDCFLLTQKVVSWGGAILAYFCSKITLRMGHRPLLLPPLLPLPMNSPPPVACSDTAWQTLRRQFSISRLCLSLRLLLFTLSKTEAWSALRKEDLHATCIVCVCRASFTLCPGTSIYCHSVRLIQNLFSLWSFFFF